MFKENWEKTSACHQLPNKVVKQMTKILCPHETLISHVLIPGGCANLNVKIQFADHQHPYILRVYLRDKDACYREQKLGLLLKGSVPVPEVLQIGELDNYRFSLTEFMPGIPLRNLLLGDQPHDIAAIMYDVGATLSKFRAYKFPKSGLFDEDLNIATEMSDSFALDLANECLESKNALSVLTTGTVTKINDYFDKYGHFFPDANEKQLVHGDYDPANIFVDKVDGVWKVSGVLDWEFAFSGSGLCDIATMLRYAHKMPAEYQNAFLTSLENNAVTLSETWRISVNLLNLLSLLDCLRRSDPQTHPNQCADIRELIEHILTHRPE